MGDVTVTTSTTSADFGLTGTIAFESYNTNTTTADSVCSTGQKHLILTGMELLIYSTPEPIYPHPVDLTIDYNREFIHRIVGSVTGNGGTGTQLLEAGPVTISGTTDFASTRYLTSEVESLTDATLDSRPSTPPWTTGRLMSASTAWPT